MENDSIKPSLGNAARGDAFYPRRREIKKIFRVLDANASIYLSAPRRVGKTSILQHLEDTDENNGYYFIYTITESVDSINDFFKVLYETMLKSKAINKLAKTSKKISVFLEAIAKHVDEIPNIAKLKEQQEPDYKDRFMDLLDNIEKGVGRVVIMVDEFPQTLHNIHKKDGAGEARKLLQLVREARHHKLAEENVSFIYTGSISLFPMVEKIGSLTDVNDLQPIEVEPLSRPEATDLIYRLCTRARIEVTVQAVDYLLDTIRCLIPFHIQLICYELGDIYIDNELTESDIDKAIDKTIDAKNKARFEPYFSRLEGLLEANEYTFAMEVLSYVAHKDSIDEAVLHDTSVKHELNSSKEIIEMLCEDGYLYKSGSTFIYTSPILQLGCKKFN